jgi:putative SOS response-associated peptidase YedK
MCGIATNTKPKKQIEDTFAAKFVDIFEDSNVPISKAYAQDPLPIITQEATSEIQFFQFGLLPAWAKNDAAGKTLRTQTINARSETIFEKPSFKNSIYSNKCLILVDGFIEYQHNGKQKQAFFISLKDKPLFAMAGIYNIWQQGNSIIKTFSIVTVEANALMATIHNSKKRMPLILTTEQQQTWLQAKNEEEIKHHFSPYKDSLMQAHTISNNIGKQDFDKKDISILQPISTVVQTSLF